MMNEYTGEASTRKSVQVPILTRELTAEVAGDYSLPDYQPEIKRLLRIGTNILPPNRFAGGDGTELQGTLDYYVLYMGHDNGVYCAPLSAEYRILAEPDAEGKGLMNAAGEPMVCLCDATAEPPVGRVTAPRRLNIRCRVKAAVKLYGEYPLTDPREGAEAIEALIESTEAGRLYWGLSDPLPLQDDVILSPAEGEWRLVCAEGKVMITEATPAAGAVNCRGEVVLKLTLCPADAAILAEDSAPSAESETRAAPSLTVMQRKIPFMQVVEMDGVTPACAATACGYCADISVEMEDGHLHAEVGVITEARAQRNETVTYVKDLYSTRRDGSCRYTAAPAEQALRALNGNFTLSDSLPLADVGVDPASRVMDVTATAIANGLTAEPSKGRCVLTGVCRCHLLLLREGEYVSADMELPFRYEFDDPSLAQASCSQPRFDGQITVVTCRARMDGERVGIDAELAVSARTHCPAPFSPVAEADFGDEVIRRRGEYLICFPSPTDTLWSVAKRYHAPMAALTAANNLPAGPSADTRESLEGAGYLIV